MKKLFTLLVFILTGTLYSYGTHVMGGDITYTCVGPNQYEITLTLYRDCSGATLTGAQTVDFSSSCGTQTASLPLISNTEVSQLCPSSLSQSTCNGGNLPGTQQIIFRSIVTLATCADWVITWDLCCRNNAITNLVNASTASVLLRTTLNSLTAPCNNSPAFLNLPTPYVCVNSLNIYSHAASDIDGDSLAYKLANPLTTPGPIGTPIAFAPGYSLLEPMLTTAGINLNVQNGEMCFTPSVIQTVVVSVIIEEWRNGVMIGSVIREMQVVVDASCLNQNPTTGVTPTCGGTGGLNITFQDPSVVQTNSNSIVMCPDDSICFSVNFTDPDLNLIDVISNVTTVLPGATFSITGNNTIAPVATFCWRPTVADSGPHTFDFIVNDNGCPISGTQTFTYNLTIFEKPFAGPDVNICGPQNAQLNVVNGVNYLWTVLSGDPIVVGTNFGCDTCESTTANPSITTTYIVTSTLSAACFNSDTVTVNVFDTADISGPMVNDTSLCAGLSINLDAGPNFDSYSWNTIPEQNTQIASIDSAGTYIVTIDSAGCILSDTVVVIGNPLPVPTILPANLNFCDDDSLTLSIPNVYDSYQWFTPVSSLNNSITITSNGSSATVVAIQVVDSNGCIGDSLFVVNNSPLPQPSILGANGTICPGDSLLLTGSPNIFSSYTWSNGDVNTTTTVPAGPIQLTVIDSNGCEGSTSATVTAQNGPLASFTATPAPPAGIGVDILFTDNSTGSILSWDWDFGDGSFDNVQNPSYAYSSPGIYAVTLTVTDVNGCVSIFSTNYLIQNDQVIIDPPIPITIPNIITPNGDGSNDVFVITNAELVDNKLTIFNRWGRKVFEQENYKNDWDSEDLSDGSYFYIFEAVLDQTIGLQKFEGSITIIK